jgi:GNAT superfamily N-acetyltransferase
VNITVRDAEAADVPSLTELYQRLEEEMAALRPAWPLVDGLAHPVSDAISERIADAAWRTYVAHLEGVPVGFLFGRDEETLPQGRGERIGSVRLLYTDREAREVGVGEAMMERFLDEARRRGISLFDAHVSPGHRLAKNFFEAYGFKARSIVMHRNDNP